MAGVERQDVVGGNRQRRVNKTLYVFLRDRVLESVVTTLSRRVLFYKINKHTYSTNTITVYKALRWFYNFRKLQNIHWSDIYLTNHQTCARGPFSHILITIKANSEHSQELRLLQAQTEVL